MDFLNNLSGFSASVLQPLYWYAFYYPFVMAWVWMFGGAVHAWIFEKSDTLDFDPLSAYKTWPMVSIVVPCFNEARHIREVVSRLQQTFYPNFEVILVNDGSTDATAEILDELCRQDSRLRAVHHETNQGKAVGLNTAALLARGEYILGIDGDALTDSDAVAWMVLRMRQSPHVGAITGNPRIRNRTTLLGRMQVGEFSSTIGLIKRSQQMWGRLFTVSGVIAMFRRKALLEVGCWNPEALTEDIDITWRLQLKGWRVEFEARALCWILMPETLRGLFKQRLRWAIGGLQTLTRYSGAVASPRQWRMWPIFIEYFASVLWAFVMFVLMLLAIVLLGLPGATQPTFIPAWHGGLLAATCLLQILVSLVIDRHYDRDLLRYYAWTVWYPIAFWLISMFCTVVALPIMVMRRRGRRAIWTSPDRGVHHA
ncbi:biofilm PGA synthesis N-glycosyltransferase PgaC [Comamonas sp. BIGb0124]|uniref:poly-beta-1,6-N-acetyl-D-glucosamine synthase n=1 Tax=Comamonas sp. BIGb0124 TaxID=2485130 RepID=UPI000F4811E9|nr:poly-beta-1,6-N-acetyl-D-glucosamine synthase [Comamonas sp. BIGb0124]ROR24919.1 biofilm PGA synthesis N-glycosyltransferase PgaC [Comamonas sp. BIGb0124]